MICNDDDEMVPMTPTMRLSSAIFVEKLNEIAEYKTFFCFSCVAYLATKLLLLRTKS